MGLPRGRRLLILIFFRSCMGRAVIEQVNEPDLATPQREGCPVLRAIPARPLGGGVAQGHRCCPRLCSRSGSSGASTNRSSAPPSGGVYNYRKLVLAIFDELVLNERGRLRVQ